MPIATVSTRRTVNRIHGIRIRTVSALIVSNSPVAVGGGEKCGLTPPRLQLLHPGGAPPSVSP